MRTVRETCSKCPTKLINPTWQTKYCPECKKLVQAEQSRKKNAEVAEQSRLRRIEAEANKKPLNEYYLKRGKISIYGDKLYG